MAATLSKSQITTLHNFVFASVDPVLISIRNRGSTVELSNYLNADNAPVTAAWNNSVSAQTMDEAANYTGYDTIVQGKRDEWSIFLQYAPRDMSKTSNEKVVTDVWGPATAGSVAESVLLAATINASVAQVQIGGTTRTQGTVSALNLNYWGDVSQTEAQQILVG